MISALMFVLFFVVFVCEHKYFVSAEGHLSLRDSQGHVGTEKDKKSNLKRLKASQGVAEELREMQGHLGTRRDI